MHLELKIYLGVLAFIWSVLHSLSWCRRVGESDYSDGEEDFYYTEIRLNTDSVADGLSSLSPVSPSLASPPSFHTQDAIRPETSCAKTETKLMTPLSRSAPTNLYLVHTDHAYQVTLVRVNSVDYTHVINV